MKKTMEKTHIILSSSPDEQGRQILSTLTEQKIQITELKDLTNLTTSSSSEQSDKIIFISLYETDETFPQLDHLLNSSNSLRSPIIICGDKVDSYVQVLDESFPIVRWCKPDEDYISIIQTVAGDTGKLTEEPEAKAPPKSKDKSEVDFTESKLGYIMTETNIEKTFDLETEILNEKTRDVFSQFENTHMREPVTHVKRVISTSQQIQREAGLFGIDKRTLEAASSLYLSSFSRDQSTMMTKNYLQESEGHLQRDIAKHLSLSAQIIKEKTEVPEASAVVEDMSLILTEEKQPENDEQTEAASFLLGIDLYDRACWIKGKWKASFAKKLMNALYEKKISILSEKSSWTVIQLIVNAFENIHTPHKVITMKPSDKKTAAPANSTQKAISQLKPGMRLETPLMTKDGSEILPADFILNSEMILRVWNLAAVRSLEPVYVQK